MFAREDAAPALSRAVSARTSNAANRACVVLCQKWDLAQADGMTETKTLPALRAMMPFLNFAPVVFCSNTSGYNIRRTIDAIDRAAASASARRGREPAAKRLT